ncbi:hypothetical protein BN135_304 [Cronobacter muytjensii 530]
MIGALQRIVARLRLAQIIHHAPVNRRPGFDKHKVEQGGHRLIPLASIALRRQAHQIGLIFLRIMNELLHIFATRDFGKAECLERLEVMVFPYRPVRVIRAGRGGPAFVGRDDGVERREFRQRLGAKLCDDAGFCRLQHVSHHAEIPALPVMLFHGGITVHDTAVVLRQRIRHALRQHAVQVVVPVREAFFHPRRVPRRLVMTAPGDNGGGVADLFGHLKALARGVVGERLAVVIAPLERDILPNHQAHFIGHPVERSARDMPVYADRVSVHIQHQLNIAAIFLLIHLAQPRRADIVTALDENPLAVQHPAFVIRLFHYLPQPGAARNLLHHALVIAEGCADAIKMREAVAFRPPESGAFHRQGECQALRRGACGFKAHFLLLRKTLARKIRRTGAQD